MKPEKDHIKDIFSSKLKGFEPELPPSLWEKIEADLPAFPIVEKIPAKTPVYRILTWVAAAAAVVLAVLFFIPQKQDNDTIARLKDDNTERIDHSIEKTKIADPDRLIVSDNRVEPEKKHSSSVLLAESGKEEKTVSDVQVASLNEVQAKDIVAEKKDVIAPAVAKDSNGKNSNVYIAEGNNAENFQPKDPAFEQDLKARIAAFEAEGEKAKNILADNNIPVKSKKSSSGSRGIALGIGGGSGLSKSDDVTNSVRYASASSDGAVSMLKREKLKMEHNQPISFGVAINKKITNRISIESGIMYTYVSARIKVDPNSVYRQNDLQYFHYLGIPLSLNYKFAEWKKIEFYSSVGGMIQKDFYGRLNSDSSIDDLINLDKSSKHKISQERPQFSAMGLLGIGYPIYNKLSAYTTFGGAYYFDAGNEYETIFSDRKWLFNLNLGLKFGF